MLKSLYTNYILNFPKTTLVIITLLTAIFGYFATNLSIDASADTLLLDNDKDLAFTREIAKRYYTPNFLVLTYTPKSKLLSKNSLQTLKSLSHDLKNIKQITSVVSILTVPLLQSPVRPVKELLQKIPTLSDRDTNKTLAKQEFLHSPLYKNSLVSDDFKTTALLLNLKDDLKYRNFIEKRTQLQKTKNKNKLEKLQKEFKKYKDKKREATHQTLEKIRKVITKYNGNVKIFLGGVSMIADDMIGFIKSDLMVYGSILLLMLITTLLVIFKEVKFVVIPILVSIVSVIFTTGFLGLFGWDVTVISSNFVSLQLIITLSIILHLIVKYKELVNNKNLSQKEIILATILSKAKPSFFAIITTIAGFGSLVLANLKPVINLGYMMSIGVATSLVISFVLFPAIMMLFAKSDKPLIHSKKFSLTQSCSNLVIHRGKKIILVAFIIAFISIYGASKLRVENSFISYFKKNTEIYKGMEVIDKKLGGTTPLDLIVTFKEAKQPKATDTPTDSFSEFDSEFEDNQNKNQYWFSPNKMQTIQKIQSYLESLKEVGNVESFGTLLEIGKTLNKGKSLDTFELAILYNEMPQKFRNLILNPYIDVKKNQVRFSMRIIDSNPNLRRNELIHKIQKDIPKIVQDKSINFRLSNLMILYNNMLQSLFKSQILTLGAVVFILFLMFLALFRSLKISLIAITTNMIPVGIIFAVMGFANIPLDVMTITIASISIGIGVDDTIHYIVRFKEEYQKDKDYTKAMQRAHNSIGYAMYYTSLAIILGFSILVFSNFIPTIYFGLLTILVMMTALASALLLLPKLLIKYRVFG
ncbi:MAG: MMPL family transporter [Campylobacteraceae bacterium]|nr:MMPL family transporter [Campylobacteraceae bacterium]